MTVAAHHRTQLRERWEGRRVVFAAAVAAAWPGTIDVLRELGAGPFVVLAGGTGTGPQPEGDDVDVVPVEIGETGGDMMEEFRAWERLAAAPPAEVRHTLDAFDPDGTAPVLVPGPSTVRAIAGRAVHGARRPEWVALEDKTANDAFFDRAGVARPPSAIVAPSAAPVAARALDLGQGTVWSGDARGGFNGGTSRVRWVRSTGDADATATFFAARHDVVRVAPFLEGIPCSIHGIVAAGEQAVFRPFEMVILRSPERGFVYAGTNTFWDPSPDDRESMRAAARRVGTQLRDEVGFRGPFTLDGIMTADGFLPTEVNPREGSALNALARAVPEVPLPLVSRGVIDDDGYDLRADDLERLLVEAADERRTGGAWTFVTTAHPEDTRSFDLRRDGSGWVVEDGGTDATVVVGPATIGAMVRFTPRASRTPVGPSLAPSAAAAFAAVDDLLGLGLGPLETARPVR